MSIRSKKLIKCCKYEENYSWNPRACACKCDINCEIGEYLKL